MIGYKLENIKQLQKAFDPELVEKALNSALGKTTKKARTIVSKSVRARYAFAAKRISREVKVSRVKSGDAIAARVLTYTGARIGLVHWRAGSATTGTGRKLKGAKRVGSSRGRRYQAHAKYRKGGGAKAVNGGFIGRGKGSGSEQIFQRIGDDRLKIKKLTGPSVAQAITNTGVLGKLDAFVAEEMPRQFDHAMDYFIKKSQGLV